jgi:energy-coupling factor transporter transmembrane protein EcfT
MVQPPVLSMLAYCFALGCFILGVGSRWWWSAPQPYYPTFISAGLAFWLFGMEFVPMILGK